MIEPSSKGAASPNLESITTRDPQRMNGMGKNDISGECATEVSVDLLSNYKDFDETQN